MIRLRLCFEKTGRAIYLSHLDLMRTFQRAFFRAGAKVWHTEGFNPKPYLSIVQPLSLGYAGRRELLDVQWEEDGYDTLPERLNQALPEGIRVLDCWQAQDKAKLVALAQYQLQCRYDRGVDQPLLEELLAFYGQEAIRVMKKTKRGESETDIRPQIRRLTASIEKPNTILVDAVLDAGTTVLNPGYLISALPESLRPDFVQVTRLGLYREDFSEFR